MDEKDLNQIKQGVDLDELDNLPETIEDLEKMPILKPLLEFHKQASMLIKEDKLEHEFLIKIKEEIDKDLETGIYDNSQIVKKYLNLTREYDRLILIYSRYTDLSDEKIIELKKIVEKYYIPLNEHEEQIYYLREENEMLRKELNKFLETLKKQEVQRKRDKPEPEIEEDEEEPEDDEENEEEEEKPVKKSAKKPIKEEAEETDKEYEEFLKRKMPKVTETFKPEIRGRS